MALAILDQLKLRNDWGPIKVRVPVLGGAIVVQDPEVSKVSSMPKSAGYEAPEILFGGPSLLTLNHDTHKAHRRIMSKGFSLSNLYSLVPAFHRHGCEFNEAIKRQLESDSQHLFDIHDWMVKVTFDIISSQAFDFD